MLQNIKSYSSYPTELLDHSLTIFSLSLPSPTGRLLEWLICSPVGTTTEPREGSRALVAEAHPMRELWQEDCRWGVWKPAWSSILSEARRYTWSHSEQPRSTSRAPPSASAQEATPNPTAWEQPDTPALWWTLCMTRIKSPHLIVSASLMWTW